MRTKLLFLDLDGTLLNDEKEINKGDMDAIEEMLSMGHKIIINSGRPLYSIMGLCEKFGFIRPGFYISAFNGGQIVDLNTGERLRSDSVDEDIARILFDKAYEMGLHVHTYTDDHVVSEKDTKELSFYTGRIHMPPMVVNDFRDVTKGVVPKIILIDLNGREKLQKYRDEMEEFAKDKLYCTFSDARLLEYANPETNKGEAIKFMCSLLGVSIEDTVAAGDEENDLPMICTAGVGVCMKNGVAALKDVADYITQNTNNECGIAEIIHKFITV